MVVVVDGVGCVVVDAGGDVSKGDRGIEEEAEEPKNRTFHNEEEGKRVGWNLGSPIRPSVDVPLARVVRAVDVVNAFAVARLCCTR